MYLAPHAIKSVLALDFERGDTFYSAPISHSEIWLLTCAQSVIGAQIIKVEPGKDPRRIIILNLFKTGQTKFVEMCFTPLTLAQALLTGTLWEDTK